MNFFRECPEVTLRDIVINEKQYILLIVRFFAQTLFDLGPRKTNIGVGLKENILMFRSSEIYVTPGQSKQ